ncbi:hypothetical protein [Rhodococcus sp. ARP2]|uniref:hypothetical protein n=1 Tax=Rhodococcus sp. ARP2 TaxID=1661385 RepID=UPI00064BB5C4|nr:hypothetical protein [Rhodococcus sp. ARP2]
MNKIVRVRLSTAIVGEQQEKQSNTEPAKATGRRGPDATDHGGHTRWHGGPQAAGMIHPWVSVLPTPSHPTALLWVLAQCVPLANISPNHRPDPTTGPLAPPPARLSDAGTRSATNTRVTSATKGAERQPQRHPELL